MTSNELLRKVRRLVEQACGDNPEQATATDILNEMSSTFQRLDGNMRRGDAPDAWQTMRGVQVGNHNVQHNAW